MHRSLQIVNCTHGDLELQRRSTIGMCLMETGFVCAVGLLLCCGSSSSFFLSARLPSFFFLSLGFSFSRFVVFYSVYFEIKCKRLKIYMAKTCPNQQVVSKSASRKQVFKTQVLYGTRVFKTRDANLQIPFIPMLTYYILSLHCSSLQISPIYT